MRRIYLILAIIFIILAFYGGYRLGSADMVDVEAYDDVIHKRDSLTIALELATAEIEQMTQIAAIYKHNFEKKDLEVVQLTEERKAEEKRYQSKIRALQDYDSTKLDDFYKMRYPDSVYLGRLSFNLNTAQRKVMFFEWRAREVAMDLVRLDSVSAIAKILNKTVSVQREAIDRRDMFISIQEDIIHKKDTAYNMLLSRESTYKAEVNIQKEARKKVQRQRDKILIGGAVVIGLETWLLIKSLSR
jgi:hypothetical protein